MKRLIGLLLLIPMLFLAARAENSAAPGFSPFEGGDTMASLAGTYKYEGEGFGGDFTITLNADGTYEFYEGPLSSYMGAGTWHAVDDVIRMTEGDAGFALAFAFGVEDSALVYLSAGSDAFPYVALSDGARFIRSNEEGKAMSKLLYQGHGSLRIVTGEGKVIYIDPYAGEGYDLPADLILVSHGHADHTAVDRIRNRAEDCRIIQYTEALVKGEYRAFDLGYATVEAVQAGNNRNHDINVCVGWLITLPDGMTVYATGDTSTTDQMAELAERNIDYAFFCCDGVYNMDIEEASACAALVNARHSIPYHMAPGKPFDAELAERFSGPGRMIVPAGEEITLD